MPERPERPDLRRITTSLRESLAGLDRGALVDILTYVLDEYVVEGPPPLTAAQVERLEDLEGLSLAELLSALQTRLEIPGLETFRIEGDQVQVPTADGWVTLQPVRPERPALPVTPASLSGAGWTGAGATASEATLRGPTAEAGSGTGRASADEALARGRGDLIGGERGVITPLSVRPAADAPQGAGCHGVESTADPSVAAQPPEHTRERTSGAPGSDDDASIRFSLLELD